MCLEDLHLPSGFIIIRCHKWGKTWGKQMGVEPEEGKPWQIDGREGEGNHRAGDVRGRRDPVFLCGPWGVEKLDSANHDHGKRHDLGLGGWPVTALAEAREQAFENRKLARSGGDPLALKRRPDVRHFKRPSRG